jgi:hypothetical protein
MTRRMSDTHQIGHRKPDENRLTDLNFVPTNIHYGARYDSRDSRMTLNISTSFYTLLFALTVAP